LLVVVVAFVGLVVVGLVVAGLEIVATLIGILPI
jgi:hypothetical protein